jgi:nicotinate-nucleotide pyrophosphorylase (carboxylating)
MAEATRAPAPADGDLRDTVARALIEDVGAGDVTSRALGLSGVPARAVIVQNQPGVVYGLEAAELVFADLDADIEAERLAPEGQWRERGEVLAVRGNAAALLGGERVALNFLGHLSGIATLTARYVRAVEGTGVRLLSIRKTTPGLRVLERAAVRAGGGLNHRAGLHDGILIKENHAALAGGVGEAVRRARQSAPDQDLEVECTSLHEVDAALAAGAGRLLLDNMTPAELREAVARVDGRAVLEASGGVSLETVRELASTGVQFISVGALTHSAPALDLSLDLHPLA